MPDDGPHSASLNRRREPRRSRAALATDTAAAREALFAAIADFRAAEEAEGKTSVDFGVKGGELDKKSRAPADLRQVWTGRVREAARAVESAIDTLAPFNPTPDATKLLGTVEGDLCPLHYSAHSLVARLGASGGRV